jgi:hypothetical protein
MKNREFKSGNGFKIPYGKLGLLCFHLPNDPWDESITDSEVWTLFQKIESYTKKKFPPRKTKRNQIESIIQTLVLCIHSANKTAVEIKEDGKEITKESLRNYGFISPDLFVNTSNIYKVIP